MTFCGKIYMYIQMKNGYFVCYYVCYSAFCFVFYSVCCSLFYFFAILFCILCSLLFAIPYSIPFPNLLSILSAIWFALLFVNLFAIRILIILVTKDSLMDQHHQQRGYGQLFLHLLRLFRAGAKKGYSPFKNCLYYP